LNYASSLEHQCPLFDSFPNQLSILAIHSKFSYPSAYATITDAKNPSSHLNLPFKGCLNVRKCKKKKNEIGFMVRLVAIQSPLFSAPLGCPFC